jgi:hypothetical protein
MHRKRMHDGAAGAVGDPAIAEDAAEGTHGASRSTRPIPRKISRATSSSSAADGDCSANSGGDGSSDLAIATRSIAALHFSAGLGGGDLAYLGDETAAAEMMRPAQVLNRDLMLT